MVRCKSPTLLNVTYIRPGKDENGDKIDERFEVIYQTENGEVHKTDEPPNADIYIVKPEFRNYNYNKPEERMELMDKVTVPISKIRFKIAEEMGEKGRAIVQQCRDTRNFKGLDQLYRWPYAYKCDFQPEHYYMKDWYDRYPLDMMNVKLTTAFIDIETDGIDQQVDMENIPNTAHSPVTLITIILEETKESWTFILRPYEPSKFGRSKEEYEKRYRMYEKQLKDHEYLLAHKDEFIADLHNSFDSTYGYLDYHLRVFDREIDLIADAFRLINNRKPNFCLIWNMRFDIQYLYYRILELGYDPKSIMCHKDFKQQKCYFKLDRTTYLLEKQFDFFYCSSYTQYICQMRLYASIRKSQHKLKRVSLNAIGDRELKDKKVEYPEASNITRFPFDNWLLFIKYNIKDVLLQVGIERKTKDVMTYYTRSHSNLTPYNKIFRETHLLRNVREMYFEKEGWVQGNNLNIIGKDEDEEEKRFYGLSDGEEENEKGSYKGAIMAEPMWNAPIGLVVLGEMTNNMFQNSMDYDMGAFYPSIKIASNMDPITLLFKGSLDNEEFISGEMVNRSLNTTYFEKDKNGNIRRLDHTGEAVNTYVSRNILTFGYNYLNLPTVTELTNIVEKELSA